jgi:hypothetical protein
MVGFLCSARNERHFANYLLKFMAPVLNDRQTYVFVFTMSNVNLVDKTVYGSLISEKTVTKLKIELPQIIFNFSLQNTKLESKKLMELMEVENLTLINSTNVFDQWTIMKMLTSDLETKRYIMPFANITKEDNFVKYKNFIVRPQNGSNLSKLIYSRKTYTGFDLYNWGGTIRSQLFNIKSAIIPVISSGKWILSVSPELITYNDRLLIIRGYLNKNNESVWKIVLKTEISQTEQIYKKSDEKIDDSLLQIISYINCFIPDLHFCTIDLVVSKDKSPYFLNLGGWQNLIPGDTQHTILFDALCRNMMAYDEIFLNK